MFNYPARIKTLKKYLSDSLQLKSAGHRKLLIIFSADFSSSSVDACLADCPIL